MPTKLRGALDCTGTQPLTNVDGTVSTTKGASATPTPTLALPFTGHHRQRHRSPSASHASPPPKGAPRFRCASRGRRHLHRDLHQHRQLDGLRRHRTGYPGPFSSLQRRFASCEYYNSATTSPIPVTVTTGAGTLTFDGTPAGSWDIPSTTPDSYIRCTYTATAQASLYLNSAHTNTDRRGLEHPERRARRA